MKIGMVSNADLIEVIVERLVYYGANNIVVDLVMVSTSGSRLISENAIASNLAKGYDLKASVNRAKEYISEALLAMLNLGKGSGPINHGTDINSRFIL